MQIIETEHLTKYYGKTPVVDSLSLSVPEGSVYGFIGPNGAGKSTTMKMLLGLVKPNSGSIRLLGKSMTQQNRLSLLRQTGSLIESPACYGHLTGEENLQILAELKNVPERNIDRVLEIVELTDSRRRKVQQYSLGMRQRLGIAQALLGNPKLLILDEPTNGLDPSGIQQMRSLIKDMPNRCGATVLISSHLLGEMEQMVDQVGIINHGRLLFQGELDDLRKHSQGDISLRVLHPEKAAPILGNSARLERGVFHLPAMDEARLAELIGRLAAAQAGVVELNRATKTLEEIFLSLTGGGHEMRAICAELKKSRRRHNALVAVGISLAALLWATQTGGKSEDISQGYSGLLYAIPIINTVIMPLGTAVLASRLWDLESKEKCCRILLTLQSRASLFFGKAAAALLQIFLMVAAESAGILALGKWAGYTDALDFGQFWWLAAATFMVNAMLFFLWLFLSVRFDNQVPTLAGGMVGSLSGLFASFMPPMVSFFMPWGY